MLLRMAERGGFEPPVQFYPNNGLANRRFRPLSHLSNHSTDYGPTLRPIKAKFRTFCLRDTFFLDTRQPRWTASPGLPGKITRETTWCSCFFSASPPPGLNRNTL